jgi:hypothetical protein
LAALREFQGVESGAPDACAAESRTARRFPLKLPVRFRATAELIWHGGETTNISSSGVLFRSHSDAKRGTLLEMRLTMPVLSSDGPSELFCRAVVVRSVPAMSGDLPAVAVRILHFRLAPA